MSDVYNTPESNVSPVSEQKGSPVKAVIVGYIIDIIGTMVLGGIFGIFYGVYLASTGMDIEQIDKASQEFEIISPLGLVSLAIGLSCSILGGYMCAKIVNYKELQFAAILAVLVVVTGFLLSGDIYSVAQHIGLTAVTVCAIFFGAYLHTTQKPD